MLRRFGWPNTGSDDYKNLCSWTLTTPMPGLYLLVTPYMGARGGKTRPRSGCGNLHFGVRFNKQIEKNIHADPYRDAYEARKQKAIRKWWKTKGSAIYTIGQGKEDDEDELVLELNTFDKDGVKLIYGFWKRKPAHTWPNVIPEKGNFLCFYGWAISKFIKEKHPEVKMPEWKSKRDRLTRHTIQIRAALKATLRDLLRPTNVRDVSFTPFGDIERTPAAIKHYKNQKSAGYFEGAGHTPEYWFTASKKERSKD